MYMEYFVVCTTQINFTQRKMFLRKWNSDNSYYLYEQIKLYFTKWQAQLCSFGGVGGAVPCTGTSIPGLSVQLCWPGGKAQEPVLRAAGHDPEHGLPSSTRLFWSQRLYWGWMCPSFAQSVVWRLICPAGHTFIQRHVREEIWGITLGSAAKTGWAQGCCRTNSVLYSCSGETLQCQVTFPKLCSYCSDADPASGASGCCWSLHTQHFLT